MGGGKGPSNEMNMYRVGFEVVTCIQPCILARRLSLRHHQDIIRRLNEPRRLSHLRHLSVCACTPHSLSQPVYFFVTPSSAFSSALPPNLTACPSLSLCAVRVQLKVNKISSVSLLSKYPLPLYLPSFLPFFFFRLCFCISCSVRGRTRTTSLTRQYIHPEGHGRDSPEYSCAGCAFLCARPTP